MSMSSKRQPNQGLSGKVIKGSDEHRLERQRYLSQIIDEFHSTRSKEVKKQILANLANFSYDPYNYKTFLQLDVIGIFLLELERTNDIKLSEFSLAGLCNLSSSETMSRAIIQKNGISTISKHLNSKNAESVVSAITALMSLIQPNTSGVHEVLSQMIVLARSQDKRIGNVATVFIEDFQTI